MLGLSQQQDKINCNNYFHITGTKISDTCNSEGEVCFGSVSVDSVHGWFLGRRGKAEESYFDGNHEAERGEESGTRIQPSNLNPSDLPHPGRPHLQT